VFTSTKTFSNYPCAHRQWRHDGNCALVHGYSRSFHFVFAAQTLDKCGFVVDFGGLHWLRDYLEYWFDHTLFLMADDP
ncbi:6-pyruvoyl trahydropterin synthase family protein, partial [Bacillus altitudinis]|uniref:6-pyruvoyl trahydropterin synthase family protein n=1 Tax=Bacillus altitudinis TaxID=293387 RepID=UPI002F9553E1